MVDVNPLLASNNSRHTLAFYGSLRCILSPLKRASCRIMDPMRNAYANFSCDRAPSTHATGGAGVDPVRRRVVLAAVASLPLWLFDYRAHGFTADFARMRQLARTRYGADAEQTIIDWQQLIADASSLPDGDKLQRINTFFNRRIRYMTDLELWNANDYWATPLETMGKAAGDCEDYAIAKYVSLRLAGVPNDKLRLIYVRQSRAANVDEAHMVLGYYATPNAEPLILDNLISDIRPASRRRDLRPVFSFNSEGLWTGGAASVADPTARLSRWRDLLERMRQEGLH